MSAHDRCLVLVVEDDESIAQFVETVLADEGYTVQVAPTGEEALQRLEGFRPALVLLDMLLPTMDGQAVLAEMRTRFGSEPPVILMTARREGAEQPEEIGAQGLLLKPFDLGDLLAQVQAVIGERCGGQPV